MARFSITRALSGRSAQAARSSALLREVRGLNRTISRYSGTLTRFLRDPSGTLFEMAATKAIDWLLSGRGSRPSANAIRQAEQILSSAGITPPPLAKVRVVPYWQDQQRSASTRRIGGPEPKLLGGTGARRPPPRGPGAADTFNDPGEPNRTGIEMFPAVGSSNVHSYGYDEAAVTLYVRYLAPALSGSAIVGFVRQDRNKRFRGTAGKTLTGKTNKPGPLYAYDGVSKAVFNRMHQAASKGKFVWDRLRVRGSIWQHKYRYRLVAGGESPMSAAGMTTANVLYIPRRASRAGYRTRVMRTSGGRSVRSLLPATARGRIARQR